ncbi:MAG: putative multidrug resistance protein family [Gammaproteobacteria bacterium]|nr:putative multidrug resistance protein family [Gammaproteobacteria bacterium]
MSNSFKKWIHSYINLYQDLPIPLWIGLSAAFINALASSVIVFLSLFFTNHRHFSVAQTGLLITLFGIGATFGAYLGGRLCNYFSSRRISIVSLLIISVTLLCTPFCHGFTLLSALMIVMGLAAYAFVPANRLWVLAQAGENDKVRTNSLRYMLINLGFGISVFIDGFLAHYSYFLLFFTNGLIIFASALTLAYAGGKDEQETVIHEKKRPFWQFHIFESKFFAIHYFILFVAIMMYAQLKITYAIYLQNHYHITTPKLSYLFLTNCLLIVALQVWIVDKARRFDQAIVAGLGTFLIGFGLFILIFGTNYYLALASACIWTLGEILALPVIQMSLYHKAEETSRAVHLGLYQSVYAFANVAGSAIGSWLYQFYHGIVLWILCGLCGALCWRLSYTIRELKTV